MDFWLNIGRLFVGAKWEETVCWFAAKRRRRYGTILVVQIGRQSFGVGVWDA